VYRHTQRIGHLERSTEAYRLWFAFVERLDRASKRADVGSAPAARWLGVSEHDVQFWRRGITVAPSNAFVHIAAISNFDRHWLCTGKLKVHRLRSARVAG
jgi:hypothetical protein